MDLSPPLSRFVVHWGEMGARWGVNRTVAQIHALLYITGRPMHAEEIADTLGQLRRQDASPDSDPDRRRATAIRLQDLQRALAALRDRDDE